MSFEEEFDKIIRQKAEEIEYPFDAKNWENANALIEADRKTERALKFKKLLKPAIAITVFVAASFITYTLFNDKDKPQAGWMGEEISKPNSAPDIASERSISTAGEHNSLLSSNSNATNQKKSDLLSVNAASNEKEIISPVLKKPTNEKQTVSDKGPKNENYDQPASETGQDNVREKTIVPAAVIIDQQVAAISPPDATKDGAESTDTILKEQDPNEVIVKEAFETQTTSDHLSGLTLSLPYESTPGSPEIDNSITIINYDDAYFKTKRKTHFMNVEGGIAYLTGWNTSDNTDGKGLNYFGGINYGIYLNTKLSIGIGAQVYNLAHMDDPYYSASHKEYDFGSTTIYTVVTCSQIYYAAIPLKINYTLNKFNKIGVGFNAAYAFNAQVNSESYYYADNVKMQSSVSNGSGIYNGMNQYNYMLSAHYSLRFAKRYGLNLEAVYGLTDLFNNTSEISNSENTSGIRLSLSYTIFDK